MMKLDVDVNKDVKLKVWALSAVLIGFYIFMMVFTFVMFDILMGLQVPYLLAYVSSNTYTTLFLAGFCLILHATYRRFGAINSCIMYAHYIVTVTVLVNWK